LLSMRISSLPIGIGRRRGNTLPRDQVLGNMCLRFFPMPERAELGDRYRAAMATKSFQSFETSYRDSNFEAWYNIRIYPNETAFRFLSRHHSSEAAGTPARDAARNFPCDQHEQPARRPVRAGRAHDCGPLRLPFHHVLMYIFRPQDEKIIWLRRASVARMGKELTARSVSEQSSAACIDAVVTGARSSLGRSRSSYYDVAPEMLVTSDPKTVLAIPLKVEGSLSA